MKKICPFCKKEITQIEKEKREIDKFLMVCDNCVPYAKKQIDICSKLMQKIKL